MRISDWSSDVCSSDLLGRLSALSLVRPLVTATDGSFSIAFSRLTGRGVVVTSTRGCVPSRRPSCRLSHASVACAHFASRSEEHTSELQSLMRISYAVFCLKKKKHTNI